MNVNMRNVWQVARRRLVEEVGQIVESGDPADLPRLEQVIQEIDEILIFPSVSGDPASVEPS